MAAVTFKTNLRGLSRDEYKGLATTLCAGCGHNSITNHIVKALYEHGVDPFRLAKMSGIGCSSKATAYFVERAHAFNAVHGRMPAVTTGAALADRELLFLGISGDGDTASIGLGQFCHMLRRNVDCTYVVENNGVYGLTKGQFSATADPGSVQRKGRVNQLETIDIAGLAVQLGASFVARSFSGDGAQLVPLLRAALSHRGTAVLDVISPCVTFNDHEGSTKSYQYVKDHELVLQDLDFIPAQEEVTVEYPEGSATEVELHDGSLLRLRKLGSEHDPRDRLSALRVIDEARRQGEVVTGLLYVNPAAEDLCSAENLPQVPLRDLAEKELRLSPAQFANLLREWT
ncbi:MAG TPA: 2-oxoacid:ferredoxin oxidoreductase subunit beta [Candidatus Dormibacteraeota bacterium]|nr:2-oxoacid:ferredoxin oxidoreductase subunit beta [Candidatus Dormibacteraeota bacterium]